MHKRRDSEFATKTPARVKKTLLKRLCKIENSNFFQILGYILGTVAGHTSVMEKMAPIHAMCLNRNPKLRPSARVIHNAYSKVLSKL